MWGQDFPNEEIVRERIHPFFENKLYKFLICGHMNTNSAFEQIFYVESQSVSNSVNIIENFQDYNSKSNRSLGVHPGVHPTPELKKGTCQFSLKKKVGWYLLHSIFNLPGRLLFEKSKKSRNLLFWWKTVALRWLREIKLWIPVYLKN